MWKWIKALNPFAVQLRNTEARLEFARVILAQAEIELADKAFYVREFAAVSAERDAMKAELEAIIEATEQDGCDTALEAVKQLREQTDTLEWREAYSDDAFKALNAELAALRERASVPIPAGVPEVKALREIGINAYLMHEQAKRENAGCIVGPMEAAATAIRDAVLAGVAGIDPPADQVEALARVLHKEANQNGNFPKPDFEKVPAIEKDRLLLLARAAIAHLTKRPEGLPSRAQLALAMFYATGGKGINYDNGVEKLHLLAADRALEILRPWLRDPVGFELDVLEGELHDAWRDHPNGYAAILDLCRSRIRPVYECKECAKWEAEIDRVRNWNVKLNTIVETVRVALENRDNG